MIGGIFMECNTFKYKKLLEIRKLSKQELSEYYRKLRCYEYDTNKQMDSSKIKKKIFFLTKMILKIDRILKGLIILRWARCMHQAMLEDMTLSPQWKQ